MVTDSPADAADRHRSGGGRLAAAIVALLAMAPVGFFYAASGLLVPGPWLYLMWVLYLALLVARHLAGPTRLLPRARGAGRRGGRLVVDHQPR